MPFSLGWLLPGDAGISQTVYKMREAVNFALREGSVRRLAESIVVDCRERDERQEVDCIFKWVTGHYRFLRDPRGLEFLKSPEVVAAEIGRLGFFQGDCDDVSAFLAAILKSVGFPVRIVIIVPVGKDSFKHVYVEAWLTKDKVWVPLDGTARIKGAGWSAEADRYRTYDV